MGMFEYKKTLSAIDKAHSSVEEVLNEIKNKLLSVNEDYFGLEWLFKTVTSDSPITESDSGLQFEKHGEGTLWGVFITGDVKAYDYGLKVVVDDCTIYDIVKHTSSRYDAFNGVGFMTKSILDAYDIVGNRPENMSHSSTLRYVGRRYSLPVPQVKCNTYGVPFVQTCFNRYDDGISLSSGQNRTHVGQAICKSVSQIVIPSYTSDWTGSTNSSNTAVRSGSTEVLPMPIKFKDSVKVYGHFRPYESYINEVGFAMLTSK